MHRKVFSCWQESDVCWVARAALCSTALLSISKESPVMISKSKSLLFKMSFTISILWIFIFWIFSPDDLTAKKMTICPLFLSCWINYISVKRCICICAENQPINCNKQLCWVTLSDNKTWTLPKEKVYVHLISTLVYIEMPGKKLGFFMFYYNCTRFLCIIGFTLLSCDCWSLLWKIKLIQCWSVAPKQSQCWQRKLYFTKAKVKWVPSI